MFNPKFLQYNAFGERTHIDSADNMSSLIDRMLRVTTKITESYASDIIYPINTLQKAVLQQPDESFARLLVFRESGVDSYELVIDETGAVSLAAEREMPFSGIQYWTLIYVPETKKVKFERVSLVNRT